MPGDIEQRELFPDNADTENNRDDPGEGTSSAIVLHHNQEGHPNYW